MDFSRNLFIYGIGNGISRFLQVLLVPLYVRVFTTQQFGIYDLIYTTFTLASLLGMMQLESFLSRFYHDETIKKKELLSTSFTFLLFFSLIATFGLVFSSGLISNAFLKTGGQNISIYLASLSIIPLNAYYFLTMLLRLENRAMTFLYVSISQLALNLLLAVLFVVYFKFGIEGIFWALFISNSLTSVYLVSRFREVLSLRIYKVVSKLMAIYCFPAMPSVFISWVNNYANRFFIVYYLSKSDVGVFSTALKLGAVFILVDATIRMTWGPFFWANLPHPAHKSIFQIKFKQITSGIILILCLYMFFIDDIYKIVTPRTYWDGLNILKIIGFNYFIYILVGVVGMGPDIVKKTYITSVLALFSLLINMSLLMILTENFGLIGTALALGVTNTFLLIVTWAVSERLYQINFDYKHLVSRLLPVLAVGLIFQLFPFSFLAKILMFGPFILIYLMVFEKKNLKILRF